MGVILAGVIVFFILAASIALLNSNLDVTDEYNRRVMERIDDHRRSAHESVDLDTSFVDGKRTLRIQNTGPDPVSVLEIRSVHEDGSVIAMETPPDVAKLDMLESASVGYEPADNPPVSHFAVVTKTGNVFTIPASEAVKTSDQAGAVNAIGIGSRFEQLEHSGHVYYGSDAWWDAASAKPYINVNVPEAAAMPNFASLVLDGASSHRHDLPILQSKRIMTVNPDGTTTSLLKENIFTPVKHRGNADIDISNNLLRVSGGTKELIKLDPSLFGETVSIDVLLDSPQSVQILSSPYETLTDQITKDYVDSSCDNSVPWETLDGSDMIFPNQWTSPRLNLFDDTDSNLPEPMTAFLISSQEASLEYDIKSSSYYYLPDIDLSSYWDRLHRLGAINSNHQPYLGPEDHPHTDHRLLIQYDLARLAHSDVVHLAKDSRFVPITKYANENSPIRHVGGTTGHTGAHHKTYTEDVSVLFDSPAPYSDTESIADSPLIWSHKPPTFNFRNTDLDKFVYYLQYSDYQYYLPLLYGLHILDPDLADAFTTYDEYFSYLLHNLPEVAYLLGDYGYGYSSPLYTEIHMIPERIDPEGAMVPLCFIAEKPYQVLRTFDSEVTGISLTLPEYHEEYRRALYLLVNLSPDTSVSIAAQSDDLLALSGDDFPDGMPYRLVKDGNTVRAGVLSSQNMVALNEYLWQYSQQLTLYTYPNSMVYRGGFSTVIFDPYNNRTLHIPSLDDRIYVVHTWAQLPVVGDVEIDNVELRDRDGGSLSLEYLDGAYRSSVADSGRIWIPIIPGFHIIYAQINGVDVFLRYSDVIPHDNVKIVSPATNTVSKTSYDSPIESINASVGTVAYVVARSDGAITAVFDGVMSGTASITHVYSASSQTNLCPRDPLTGWIQVYRNGILVDSSDPHVDQSPHIDVVRTPNQDGSITDRAVFTYDKVPVSYTTTTMGNAGDFIEFRMNINIMAEYEFSPSGRPDRCTLTEFAHASSTATATANIHSGSILVD